MGKQLFGEAFPVYDPSTEEVIAHVASASVADVDKAVKAARAAFDSGPWAQTTAVDRGRILFKLAEKNSAKRRNAGRTRMPQQWEANRRGGVRHRRCRYLLRILRWPGEQSFRSGKSSSRQRAQLHVARTSRRRGPDYSVELSTCHGFMEARSCNRRGLLLRFEASGADPTDDDGSCKLVRRTRPPTRRGKRDQWNGRSDCSALVAHPGVDKIAFTGSAAVGKIIVKSAADTLKRVTLELGGKSPNVFFADADWEAAVDGALFGVFINQGEVCSAGSRILVEKKIYNKFVEAMTEKAKRIKLGPPLERETKMGPLVSKEQYDRVSSYLELGKQEAKTASGGGRPKQFDKGYYVEPTIFYDVDNSAHISREEIFGPVATVISFENEADAIRISNDTPYGLAGAVWTRDIYKAFRVVKSLRAGIIWVNHMQPTYVEAPWGGYKQSGFGRELGPWGMEEYLETKQVYVNLDETPIGWY